MNTRVDYHIAAFGEHCFFFFPEDDPSEVNRILKSIYAKQEANQFGKERYAIYFLPGEYDSSIEVEVGFYTQISGLGEFPGDTVLPSLQCLARWLGGSDNHNATCNFWRGVENLSINGKVTWAVSQATFMRRMFIDGALYLHDDYGWASGGFLSDSIVTKMIDSGTQQQWLSRNNEFPAWLGENWNMVFVGDEPGSDPSGTWPGRAYTSIDETPCIREKPYLVYDADSGFAIVVPECREKAQGVSWRAGGTSDRKIPLADFYIARPETDNAESINAALASGLHLFLTPGVYLLDEPLHIVHDGTVVLGSGLATLTPVDGNEAMVTDGAEGITIAGILFDAGPEHSENLLRIGMPGEFSSEPILLADLFFRVGGADSLYPGTCVTCLVLNTSNVIGDNFWIWRADHGDNVGWDMNTADSGLVVNGDDVVIYCLMVEHFQKYQVTWNGERGQVYMYQSELPYDVPDQTEWASHEGNRNGFASFQVSENVSAFTGVGWGIYSYNRDAIVEEYCAVEVPDADGVVLHNVCTVMITGNPGITHVVNDTGDHAYHAGKRSMVIDYGA